MPLIPLEDNFADVLKKAQTGRKLTDERLCSVSGISAEDFAALKEGKPIIAALRRVARHLRLNPDAIEAMALQKYYPKRPLLPRGFAMFNTPCGDFTVNSYLCWDSRSKQAFAVDTGTDASDMIEFIRSEGLRLQYILITHNHEDHIADLEKLAKETKAEVWSSEAEPLSVAGARNFKPDAYFHIGEISIKALLTPGHSPGLCTYYVQGLSLPVAFCGDAIFAGSMGGSADHFEQQYRSNVDKIMHLTKDTVLAPGHGPLTTLAQEKQHNPFFSR